jgi:hypothetical protein
LHPLLGGEMNSLAIDYPRNEALPRWNWYLP